MATLLCQSSKSSSMQPDSTPRDRAQHEPYQFSPQKEYDGANILLTGSLGYLGSVVLEQLLRATQVNDVFLLTRGKRSLSAAQRVEQLLCSPLFNMLHKQASNGGENVFHKVHTIEGDLLQPGLGLSETDAAMLKQEVDIVLHCAASVQLDADIQVTLRVNYLGTRQVLALAASMQKLRSFVHVSTYFVNNHRPRNSFVKEQIYDLNLFLPQMPHDQDDNSDCGNSSSSSTDDDIKCCCKDSSTSVAVRDSTSSLFGSSGKDQDKSQKGSRRLGYEEFVSALLAMSPEQASAAAAAVMAYNGFNSTYALGKHLTEQMVAATCLKPGLQKAIVRPSLISSLAGAPYPGYISGYAGPGGYTMAYALGFFQGSSSVAFGADHILDLIPGDTVASLVVTAGAAAAAATAAGSTCVPGQQNGSTTIYHAASSGSYPLSVVPAFSYMHSYFKDNPAPLRLPFTRLVRLKPSHFPTTASIQRGRQAAQRKVELLAGLLRLAGQACTARQLENGFKAFCVQNQPSYGASFICSVDNVCALRAAIVPEERPAWQHIVWEPFFGPDGQQLFPSGTWDHYGALYMSGVRHLLLKMTNADKNHPSAFQLLPAARPEVLKAGLTGLNGQPGKLEPVSGAGAASVAASTGSEVLKPVLTQRLSLEDVYGTSGGISSSNSPSNTQGSCSSSLAGKCEVIVTSDEPSKCTVVGDVAAAQMQSQQTQPQQL